MLLNLYLFIVCSLNRAHCRLLLKQRLLTCRLPAQARPLQNLGLCVGLGRSYDRGKLIRLVHHQHLIIMLPLARVEHFRFGPQMPRREVRLREEDILGGGLLRLHRSQPSIGWQLGVGGLPIVRRSLLYTVVPGLTLLSLLQRTRQVNSQRWRTAHRQSLRLQRHTTPCSITQVQVLRVKDNRGNLLKGHIPTILRHVCLFLHWYTLHGSCLNERLWVLVNSHQLLFGLSLRPLK